MLNFLTIFLLFVPTMNHHPEDSITSFRNQLDQDIQRNLSPPPEYDTKETCYHYTELLKIEINKSSKVFSIQFSDSAPDWLKEDINRQNQRNVINYKKLDSLALKYLLRNCTLVFPLVIESEDFPCGTEKKKRSLSPKYFQFGGKNLRGNIIFGEEIKCILSIRYIRKTDVQSGID